ncbi:hypothetical protein DSO57_1031906 [Entomophthora muscae]|uniref:Uncharacterized protein n=1 Tax=Entomophthora muscae TaxID=34485 RepID=A0ACC2UBD4_9FUNG|nr:hypothetical protein DSO57_1031906 [Entomophthora muscae]
MTTNSLQIKNVVLADEHHIAMKKETASFSVMLENLHSTIQGPVIDFPKFDIVLGLDWLRKNNPQVDWATSVLTIKREGINHYVVFSSRGQHPGGHGRKSLLQKI